MPRIKNRSPKATQLAVERLFDKEDTFTAFEVMKALPGTCERYVRTVLTRLQDKGAIEAVQDDATGLLHYRKASRAKPFLLGLCWRKAFPVGECGVALQ